jgi:hypothetical protein
LVKNSASRPREKKDADFETATLAEKDHHI